MTAELGRAPDLLASSQAMHVWQAGAAAAPGSQIVQARLLMKLTGQPGGGAAVSCEDCILGAGSGRLCALHLLMLQLQSSAAQGRAASGIGKQDKLAGNDQQNHC